MSANVTAESIKSVVNGVSSTLSSKFLPEEQRQRCVSFWIDDTESAEEVMSGDSNQNNETADEDQIVEAAMRGDLPAFEKLVRIHQGAVRGFLAARLSRGDDAEDLAQEVFITAYRRRKTFSGEVKIESWLRGIARNLLRNHVRKFRAKPIGGNDELQAMIDMRMDEEVAETGVISVLRECVSELDPTSRELVSERYLEGLSVRELASQSGRGYSALTMQLHRIRNGLAMCVEGKLGFVPNAFSKNED
ncbi:sigma-70 family RNA polymerase sigma factor [Verrucomicrobiaceae bacterium 227]